MSYKTMKVFDVRDLPENEKSETIQWLKDLNSTAVSYNIGAYGDFTPLDNYLMKEGCADEEEVLLFLD
jgi:hypothetical protein